MFSVTHILGDGGRYSPRVLYSGGSIPRRVLYRAPVYQSLIPYCSSFCSFSVVYHSVESDGQSPSTNNDLSENKDVENVSDFILSST